MKQKGFSLTEVVVAVVVLAIIGLFSAPKMMQMQREARINTLEAFVGAFHATNEVVMTKAKIQGVEKESLAKLSDHDIYIRMGSLALDDFNVANAMQIDGFNLANMGSTETPSLLVYLGKEKSLQQIRDAGCFINIHRPFTAFDVEGIVAMDELKVSKFYDYC
ncbi:prepilin-type N-terminal cleavage/methylation domain-containing protein [Vibrio sp. ED002]|uniref:prepilin-type N-terminal cleavage/methylation domain-containing protein n=1 Tax=Vibrio TaxID=662 RepID=UPI00200F8F26|nr:prepilin-type N-terminal cleavage/methylation domain-containing protein [Vibrio sp. ED002]UQA51208.1 prepilin-type N-terminal cleavage/methylation domain-containing protein [Vibrio sp. ED002]